MALAKKALTLQQRSDLINKSTAVGTLAGAGLGLLAVPLIGKWSPKTALILGALGALGGGLTSNYVASEQSSLKEAGPLKKGLNYVTDFYSALVHGPARGKPITDALKAADTTGDIAGRIINHGDRGGLGLITKPVGGYLGWLANDWNWKRKALDKSKKLNTWGQAHPKSLKSSFWSILAGVLALLGLGNFLINTMNKK